MATDAGELLVKISADISDLKTQLTAAATNVQSLGAKTVAGGILMSDAFKKVGQATVDFVKESVLAFAEHEQTMTRLNILVGRDAAQAMEDFGQSMQRTTAFSDDEVLSLEKQLSQYGVYPGSVKDATKALMDFASVTGVDLPEAGTMLGKAMSGQSRELKAYGIDVSTSASRSQNLATVTKALEDRFQGAAETMKGTTSGALKTLNNNVDDLKKNLGELSAPVLNKATGALNDWLRGILDGIKGAKGYNDTLEDQRAKLAWLTQEAKDNIAYGHQLTQTMKDNIKATADHVAALAKLASAKNTDKGATDREIASIRALKDEILKLQQEQQHLQQITQLGTQKRLLNSQMELAQLEEDQKMITTFTEIETQKRLEASQASWEANASFSDQLKVKMSDDISQSTAAWVNMASQMLDSFAQSTAKMIVEGGKFSDVLKNMWQQIAEQVIAQIIRMIAEWLVWMAMTGGSGGAFAGFMADGGMINEPSVITGLRTGKKHMVGEAGPEMVVPTGGGGSSGGNFAFSQGQGGAGGMGGGGGGDSGITINISGQFIEGSQAKWQRMIQDQIIPQLRRFSMKQPDGVVNRKRGAMS